MRKLIPQRGTAKLIIGIAIGAVLATAGVAVASIPSSDGTIHACIQPQNGNVTKIIDADAGQHCASNEQPLDWPSLSGKVANADRAEQLRLVVEITSENVRDGGRVAQAVATCPSGYKVSGGGVEVEVSGTAYRDNILIKSTRFRWTSGSVGSFDSWLVEYDAGPDGDPGSFKAIAMCVNAAYWWQDGAPFQTPPATPPYPGNS
jgi:hypothetical protein